MGDTTQRNQDIATVGIPRTSEDIPEHRYGDDLDGYEELNERRQDLGQTWIEFMNGQAPDIGGGAAVDLDSETVAETVAERVAAAEGDVDEGDIQEIVEKHMDDLVDDVRAASFQGAREALEEARL